MPKAILFDFGGTVLEDKSYDLVAGLITLSNSLCTNTSVEELIRSEKAMKLLYLNEIWQYSLPGSAELKPQQGRIFL